MQPNYVKVEIRCGTSVSAIPCAFESIEVSLPSCDVPRQVVLPAHQLAPPTAAENAMRC